MNKYLHIVASVGFFIHIKILELGFNYGQSNNTIYTALDHCTVTAVTHLGTTIHIALSHMKMSQIKTQTQRTFYRKDY